MKVVIVDDDKKICRFISGFIADNFPDISVVDITHDIESGYHAINKHSPNLLFLDIRLPDGMGFDLLRKFDSINFKVIFITGYEKFALLAIKFSALDYLLKPIDPEELTEATRRALEMVRHEEENVKIDALLENYNEKKVLKRVILKTSECIHVIKVEDIIRCEADNNYTFFFLRDGNKILISRTIKEYCELLKPSGFLRVHQSHLINVSYIDKFVKSEGGYILMKDKSQIPVSIHNKHLVIKELENLLYR